MLNYTSEFANATSDLLGAANSTVCAINDLERKSVMANNY